MLKESTGLRNYILSGVITNDVVMLNDPASGTYDTKNAGTFKTVTVIGLALSGADAANYTVNGTAAGPVGTIDAAALTLNAVSATKTYDGGVLSSTPPSEVGLLGSDGISSFTQSYNSRNAGVRTLAVDPGYVISDGNNGKNYAVTLNTAGGTINRAALDLTAVSATKTYDGGVASSVTPNAVGLVSGDSVSSLTQSYDLKNAGPRTLSVNGGYVLNDGNGGANYTVTTTSASGTINTKALTASLIGTVQKTYDGSTSASLASGNYSLSGVVLGDSVNLNDPLSGIYDTKNAGTLKTVSVSGLAISGADSANYTVNGTAAGAVGIITPAALTLTAVTDTRTYDGGVTSSGAPTNSALIEGDSLSNLVQSFDSKNAGARTLLVTGYTINDGNEGRNYTVTLVSAPGTINPAALTLAAVTDGKTYDGTTASSAKPNPTGLVGGDSLSSLTQSFDSRNAGARTLAIVGYTISDGNGGGNYTVTTTTAAGTIDPKALTASLVGSVSKPFDGNASASLASGNYSLSGLISGDQVSLNDPTSGTYDTANAGTHKTVSVGGLALSGADAANYTVNGQAAAAIGSISAPPQPIVINLPPTDLITPDFDQAAAFVAGSTASNTTVVNVFPVGAQNPGREGLGDSSPITGAGNRDLWTGSDESDKTCAPNTTCPANGGNAP